MGKEEERDLDPELENGPLENRSCNDIICCLLFIAAVVAMFVIGIYGYSKGEPSRLAIPYDSDGNGCGVDTKVQDYPYIYFVVPWPGYLYRTVCVKTCPTYQNWSQSLALDCVTNGNVSTCKQSSSSDLLTMDTSKLSSSFNLASPNVVFVYNTTGIFGRICFPSTEYLTKVDLGSSTIVTQSEEWMTDLKNSWEIIFVSLGIALVFGFVYMLLMRYCSGVFTWLAILAYILALIAFGYILFKKAKDNEASVNTATDDVSGTTNQSSSNNTLRIAAYVLWAIAGITVVLICCLFNKIRLAIAIIKTASSFMKDCPLTLFVPIVIFVFVVGWLAYWISAALFLYSVGDIAKYSSSPFAGVTWSKTTRYLIIYFIFGGLWVNAFILAMNQFILGSTVAIWYFSQQKPHAPITRSVYRAFRYHLGSLAFGSFILAVVQFIRLVLTYIQTQLKKAHQDNKLVKCIICCCQCYMDYLERFIKFLNKNAYIQIAISGKTFCFAAKDAFFLILRNPAKFGIVAGIGELFIFIGKIFIAALGTISAFAIIAYCEPWKSKLSSPVLPTIFFFIASLAVGILFMSVYGMAIDSILQCYCLDEELNKKKGRDPAHSPAPLRDFMDKVEKDHPSKKNKVEEGGWDK